MTGVREILTAGAEVVFRAEEDSIEGEIGVEVVFDAGQDNIYWVNENI